MKWLLVDKYDCINSSTNLHSGFGINAAKAYFMGMKRLEEQEFDKLWKVISENEYDRIKEATTRADSHKGYDWWKDEETYLDIDK